MWLELGNIHARVLRASDDEKLWLYEVLTFEDPRRFYVPGLIGKDVATRLYNTRTGLFPAGFAPIIVKKARARGFEVEWKDSRVHVPRDPQADLAWLRDYQAAAVDAVAQRRRGILWLPTGAGKTEIAIAVMRAWPARNWLFLVHKKGLMHQGAKRFELRAEEHGTATTAGRIGDGLWAPRAVTFATFQTLAQRMKTDAFQELRGRVGGLIVDECFPAGTQVGARNIEDIRPGDFVPTWHKGALTFRRVLNAWESRAALLVEVVFNDGTSIVCTPGHPFQTPGGWVPAARLGGQRVFAVHRDTLRRMPDGRAAGAADHRHRGRRAEPLQPAHTGPKKKSIPTWLGVDRVAILDPGAPQGLRGCSSRRVYNLHVAGTNTYFVEGKLAHNCHTLPADSFYKVAMAMGAADIRIGVSGTPLARGDKRSLFSVAALGPTIYRIRPELLIKRGVLARPHITMVPVQQIVEKPTWQGQYGEGVVRSTARNRAIVGMARRAQKPALIFVQHVKHGRELTARIRKAGISAEFAWGAKSQKQRERAVHRLAHGDVDVLVCSVIFQEGTDIPELASVIIASGGKSAIAALQRVGRGMRRAAGKSTFEVWDIADTGTESLEKHARARQRAYVKEGYDVTVEEDPFGLGGRP